MCPGDILDIIYTPETHGARFPCMLIKGDYEEGNNTKKIYIFIIQKLMFMFQKIKL